MRVFLDGSSPLAEKPLAGFSCNERMLSLWGTHCQISPEPWSLGSGGISEPTLWIHGLFPFLTQADVTEILSTEAQAKVVWFHAKRWPDKGVLRLEPGTIAPTELTMASLKNQYGDDLKAVDMTHESWLLLENSSDYAELSQHIFKRNRALAIKAGACLMAPEQTWIEDGVHLDPGVVIGPSVYLARGTHLESDVVVQMGSCLKEVHIAAGTTVKPYSVIEGSTIGQKAQVGPFSHIRPGTKLGADTKVGNFVETKKAILGDGSKASHLTYLGDAVIGADCNIGAGTITCNYDGYNKWKTQLGDGVFIGSSSQLVAPVTIGDGGYVAAGSTVTKDVPDDGLAIARSKQVTKPGRAETLRKRAKRIRDASKKSQT